MAPGDISEKRANQVMAEIARLRNDIEPAVREAAEKMTAEFLNGLQPDIDSIKTAIASGSVDLERQAYARMAGFEGQLQTFYDHLNDRYKQLEGMIEVIKTRGEKQLAETEEKLDEKITKTLDFVEKETARIKAEIGPVKKEYELLSEKRELEKKEAESSLASAQNAWSKLLETFSGEYTYKRFTGINPDMQKTENLLGFAKTAYDSKVLYQSSVALSIVAEQESRSLEARLQNLIKEWEKAKKTYLELTTIIDKQLTGGIIVFSHPVRGALAYWTLGETDRALKSVNKLEKTYSTRLHDETNPLTLHELEAINVELKEWHENIKNYISMGERRAIAAAIKTKLAEKLKNRFIVDNSSNGVYELHHDILDGFPPNPDHPNYLEPYFLQMSGPPGEKNTKYGVRFLIDVDNRPNKPQILVSYRVYPHSRVSEVSSEISSYISELLSSSGLSSILDAKLIITELNEQKFGEACRRIKDEHHIKHVYASPIKGEIK